MTLSLKVHWGAGVAEVENKARPLGELLDAGLSRYLALEVAQGRVEEAAAWARHKLDLATTQLRSTPVEEWPSPSLVWDLAPEHFHLALDGVTLEEFRKLYPDLELAEVEVEDLHWRLAERAQRVEDPLSDAYISKTARLIAHLYAGGTVTPPLLKMTSAGPALDGGYHRFNWARRLGEKEIPVLVEAHQRSALEARIPSLGPR